MTPLGYILSQHDPYGTRPAPGYRRWTNRFPAEFRTNLLDPDGNDTNPPANPDDDPYFLGLIKNYRSLIMVAIEMHKPISELRPADGAFGALMSAVVECRRAYRALAEKVLERLI